MRITCIGAGAIGGYVGGHLASAGHDVVFVARGATATALRERGLRLTRGPGAPVQKVRVGAVADVTAALNADVVIVAVKAYDTEVVVEQMRAGGTLPPPMLCLQNGVEGETMLAAAFGADRVIAGTVTSPVSMPAPGEVVVEKARGMGIAMGHSLSAPLVEALNGSSIRTRAYPAAGPMKWSKLLTNLLGNATAAIVDWPVAAVFAEPRLFALEAASQRECLAVMRAYGYKVVDLPGVPVRLLTWAVTTLPPVLARPLLARVVGGGRGGKRPSLHMDLHARRARTEVQWLNGAVARHGARMGVRAPVNAMLAETVEALAAGQLAWEHFRGKPEALAARLK